LKIVPAVYHTICTRIAYTHRSVGKESGEIAPMKRWNNALRQSVGDTFVKLYNGVRRNVSYVKKKALCITLSQKGFYSSGVEFYCAMQFCAFRIFPFIDRFFLSKQAARAARQGAVGALRGSGRGAFAVGKRKFFGNLVELLSLRAKIIGRFGNMAHGGGILRARAGERF
jgi:hypothetical protein